MKPFINLEDLKDFSSHEEGSFQEECTGISEKIGAKKLSYSITKVPPGKKVCPYHNHHINEEMFFILEGEGTLRFGNKEYPLKNNDIIACPPGGTEVAHQIINTGNKELSYFCLSTNEPHDICEYPDSQKMMAMVGKQGERTFRHVSKMLDVVDYWDGEM